VKAGTKEPKMAETATDADHDDRMMTEQAQSGDHRAFAALVGRHDPRLRALALRLLRDPERAEDALQNAYLKAFRTITRFRGEARVGTWLYRITYNACLDELRRREPAAGVDDAFDPPSTEPGPAEHAVARAQATDALRHLPANLRTTLMLVDGYGFNYEEASRMLRVPTGTVASRVSRARTRVRRRAMATADAA
jgi:RNA polymerase sigma-70 factor, ECF subfamily